MYELVDPSQMAMADRFTIQNGTPGSELMENAGLAIAETIDERFPSLQNVLILCGIGNNGGDGFVAARHLSSKGRDIQAFVCGDITRITGDAELALAKIDRALLVNHFPDLEKFDLIVDALFGAGLDREVVGDYASVIEQINQSNKPVISVDLPSGVHGGTGQIMGCAIRASHTVTFFRKKPGHVLLPGRQHCGECSLHQIGIDSAVLEQTGVVASQNHPNLWLEHFPIPAHTRHKYDRGHTLVISGPATATGAARLVAKATLRSGSGLVTLATSTDALAINASHLTSVMLRTANNPAQIQDILEDKRFNCVALGPGLPSDENTVNTVLKILEMQRITVLDAGALTAFARNQDLLFDAIKSSGNCVFLTPHEGEFSQLFPDEISRRSKIAKTESAAAKSGANIILKGADTVVATQSGEVSISDNAPPWLATAGSGDVLTGIVAGLASQGMRAFEAASAAVWLHGDAADRCGPAMISSDLDAGLRRSINHLISSHLSQT